MPSIDDNLRTSLDFRDISLSFAKHPITDDIGVFYNEDAIKRSVQNLVRTRIGDRFYNPLLGSKIEDLMFEQATQDIALDLEDEILILLENYEPRVTNSVTRVVYPQDTTILNVTIAYDIVGITAPRQQVDLILQSTRV